jgi:CheY-like chemotaxis protein
MKEALKLLRSTIPSTIDIEQHIEIGSDIVYADATQIHQILMNLCTNAAHAMREKGGIIQVSLEEKCLDMGNMSPYSDLPPGNYLQLTVRDTGHGISPEIMERIFEPYFTTKRHGEGTGMGLAVVHGIVKGHGGEITVESKPGIGTVFHVLLPKVDKPVEKKKEMKDELPTGTERLFFVDDEKAAVNAIGMMMERLGYRVDVRTSSVEALEAFRNKPDAFDLVITDMTMPNMTGVDLAREIMKIRPDIPILLCTGYSEVINEETAKKMGIREFIMKPILMKDLAAIVRNVLDS